MTIQQGLKGKSMTRVEGDHLQWAVERWEAEVKNRPLTNVHRRTLDTTWRQVIRHFGGDPDVLVGLSHDELLWGNPANEGDFNFG
jgi:hypothetical protein